MFELVELLFAICRFKQSPRDVPYSLSLLYITLLLNIAVSFLLLGMQNDWLQAILQAIVSVALMTLFTYIALWFSKKLPRFRQTLTSWLGCDALMSLLAIPAMATLTLGQAGMVVQFAMMGIFIWQWFVIAYIFKLALDQQMLFTLGLGLLYLLVSYWLMGFIFYPISQ